MPRKTSRYVARIQAIDRALADLDTIARRYARHELSSKQAQQKSSEICTRFGPTLVLPLINWFQAAAHDAVSDLAAETMDDIVGVTKCRSKSTSTRKMQTKSHRDS